MTISEVGLDNSVAAAVAEFAGSQPYRGVAAPWVRDNPYRRPLDAGRLARLDLSTPLREDQFAADESLMANRFLMNVYESGALFLPEDGLRGKERDFEAFYSTQNRLLADRARHDVEHYALSFLDTSVRVNGDWDMAATEAHLEATITEAVTAERTILRAIEAAPDRRRAAETLIAQMALDGLTEATAMSQNLGGAFGPEQSELFKIFIDEFGYGVFDAKHSKLFTDLCASADMSTRAHHYWFYYLPSSIAVNNYFYWVTQNRTGFFRYIGAMALLEATFAPYFAQLAKTLRVVYGEDVDTRYCDEHAHIDQHHGRMAVHDLLLPLARKHGPVATHGLIRGVEEIRLLGVLADNDLLAQLQWDPSTHTAEGDAARTGVVSDLGPASFFETRMAAGETTVSVLSGVVDLYRSPTGDPLQVKQGEAVTVPSGRLYGLRAESDASIAVSDR
ncbi:iron-containing redox enzyme family protein [Kutzneria albida]|uniref:Iron-containing redox enzyme family protein n=1 Tax=Kutzneria albida DSM 43870 TaxID=1449976 RepID=W5WG54_9PSEU|nr:iron-containing redox enzyme family protein [Kutzneria albida]AHH99596.1 hypothetical protein KALB_6236 [Kutzneria albida DSM 43870]